MEAHSSADADAAVVVAAKDTISFRARQFIEWGRKSAVDGELTKHDGVVIVSYFLPVILSRSSSGQWSASWDNENLLSLNLEARVTWVGSVRYQGAPIPADEEEAVAAVLADMNCQPVFINQGTHFQFYDVFCKQSLWLTMHHVADVYGPLNQSDIGAKGQQDLWFNYSTVNRIFRDKVVEVYHPGDLVWIQGFHLMLLPSFLRRVLQVAKIGYFFHTPFPSSEIWRTMTRREDLLRGILASDQIGFHLFEYARHFMTTCHRLLGHTSEVNAAGSQIVNVDGREVSVTCIHVGVDMPRIQLALASSEFESDMRAWRDKFPGKTIVAGIDRLERLKGIPLKLIAIEQFLDEEPHWRGKVVFTMIGVSAQERGDDYRQTQHEVKVRVDKINSKFATADCPLVVYFEERKEHDLRLGKRLSFFAGSDILMITPTRDGLNRLPMEFTLARHFAGQLPYVYPRTEGAGFASQGVAIVSEFISSARVMRGALIVNPWKVDEMKIALRAALEMKDNDRADRMRRNLEFSTRLTTVNWAKEVLRDLKSVEKADITDSYAVGFGMGFRVMGVKAGFHPLDMVAVTKSYRAATHRLVVLDWGGTLVAENDKVDKLQAYALAKGHATRAGPTGAMKETLETLCADEKNVVFVVSGKQIYAVSDFFGDVKGLGLGAEHGFYYKWPAGRGDDVVMANAASLTSRSTSPSHQGQESPKSTSHKTASGKWQTVQALGDQTWMKAAKMIIEIYVQRTHGTYMEQKGNELIWQFRDADPEFGFMQSKELEDHLKEIMSVYNVEVLRGGGVADGYIAARPKGVNKGLFMNHALATMQAAGRYPDFILAVGDDNSDEPMFEALNALLSAEVRGVERVCV
jgi:trehalose 6-phosphate synthase/phosphatase